VRGDWNEDFFAELEDFIGDRKQKDDQVDATSDAFNTLCKQIQLPTFAVPMLEKASPVPKIS
jgi:phage terminase large subunit-like protein